MGRDPRPSFHGEFVHVTARALSEERLFRTHADALLFLRILAQVVPRHVAGVEAYCLMSTHVHLLVAVCDGDLSALMRDLNGRYVRVFNKRHGRRGPLLDRRFQTTVIRDDDHALTCIRYIARNPVEARLCDREGDWRWSSHRALAGSVSRPSFLTCLLLGDGDRGMERYRALFDSEA